MSVLTGDDVVPTGDGMATAGDTAEAAVAPGTAAGERRPRLKGKREEGALDERRKLGRGRPVLSCCAMVPSST
tara:strand:- start:1200 stop:1418 length:219 start_codon:yes stop_codon:yes gene_type:complete